MNPTERVPVDHQATRRPQTAILMLSVELQNELEVLLLQRRHFINFIGYFEIISAAVINKTHLSILMMARRKSL